jgi:Na+/H+-translocating membrane pyrophosphatase
VALKIGTNGTYTKSPLLTSLGRQPGMLVLWSVMIVVTMVGVILLAGAFLSSATGVSWLPTAFLLYLLPSVRASSALPESLSLITNGAGILVGMFVASFALYLLAVHYLPRYVSHRFVLRCFWVLPISPFPL